MSRVYHAVPPGAAGRSSAHQHGRRRASARSRSLPRQFYHDYNNNGGRDKMGRFIGYNHRLPVSCYLHVFAWLFPFVSLLLLLCQGESQLAKGIYIKSVVGDGAADRVS